MKKEVKFKSFGDAATKKESKFCKKAVMDMVLEFADAMNRYDSSLKSDEKDANDSYRIAATLIMSFAATALHVTHTRFNVDLDERMEDVYRITKSINRYYLTMVKEQAH